mmetsp:Transcript_16806/g.36442  ORF Transcript_16806/g.36442 Transcript_16806/m.36442 type:complete len:336 (-) Transcript_16806:330-1337(-)
MVIRAGLLVEPEHERHLRIDGADVPHPHDAEVDEILDLPVLVDVDAGVGSAGAYAVGSLRLAIGLRRRRLSEHAGGRLRLGDAVGVVAFESGLIVVAYAGGDEESRGCLDGNVVVTLEARDPDVELSILIVRGNNYGCTKNVHSLTNGRRLLLHDLSLFRYVGSSRIDIALQQLNLHPPHPVTVLDIVPQPPRLHVRIPHAIPIPIVPHDPPQYILLTVQRRMRRGSPRGFRGGRGGSRTSRGFLPELSALFALGVVGVEFDGFVFVDGVEGGFEGATSTLLLGGGGGLGGFYFFFDVRSLAKSPLLRLSPLTEEGFRFAHGGGCISEGGSAVLC